MMFLQYPSAGSTGRPQLPGWGSSGTFASNGPPWAGKFDQLIGRKVWTRWPKDNNFYEAVISDYNPTEECSQIWHFDVPLHVELWFNLLFAKHCQGRHALVYDINTSNESLEWVNLKEVRIKGYASSIESSNLVCYFLSLIFLAQ